MTIAIVSNIGEDLDGSRPVYTETALVLPEAMAFEEWREVGAQLARMEGAVNWWLGDWWNDGEWRYGERAELAAGGRESADYMRWNNAGWVARAFERSTRVDRLSWSHHRLVAGLPPAERASWLARALAGDADGKPWPYGRFAREVRAARTHARAVTPALPIGVYNVMLADPPWEYDGGSDVRPGDLIGAHYPTLPLQAIKDLAVSTLTAAEAALFLWSPSSKLGEALEVMAAWGFEYRTCFVWVKDRIGLGHYVRQRHELLLLGRRGDFPTPREADRPDSVIESPMRAHSRKPDAAYEIIERMYPGATRVELFARERREGWEAWGDQLSEAQS